jgi:hypothetical protein
MPVSTETAISGPFIPNGATTEFPFDFKAAAADEIEVVDQDGATVSSALYSVTLDADEGGTVEFSDAPELADYDELYILSVPLMTQGVDFGNAGPSFNPASLTRAIDKSAIRDIYLKSLLDRAVLAPFGLSGIEVSALVLSVLESGAWPTTPGGNILSVGLFSALGTMTIDEGTNMIATSGYGATGRGPAFYIRDGTSALSTRGTAIRDAAVVAGISSATATAAVAATEAYWRKADAAGNYWTISPHQRIESAMFGAVHDAQNSGAVYPADTWLGTDNRLPIQAMIDWSWMWQNNPEIHLSPGNALLGDTLHVGYGATFAGISYTSLSLIGAGTGTYGTSDGKATVLVRNFVGKPLINVAGGRGIVLDQFATYGRLAKYIDVNGLCNNTYIAGVGASASNPGELPTIDDTVATGWDDPAMTTALGRLADYRYAPDCAICIDGYAGTAPATSYPSTTYPGWFGPGQTQYGKNNTTQDVLIGPTRVAAFGEINYLVTCPSATIDANTDYVQIGNLSIHYSKRAVSITHTQHHNFNIGSVLGNFCFEIVTNNTHGKQQGRMDGEIAHANYNGLIQLGSFGSTLLSGPVAFRNCYVENAYRVLTVEGGNGIESPIELDRCSMIFDLQTEWRGAPARMIGKAASNDVANVPVVINGGDFKAFKGAFTCRANVQVTGGALFDCYETGNQHGGATVATYLAAYNNGTAGGIVLPRLTSLAERGVAHDSTFQQRKLADGSISDYTNVRAVAGFRYCDRDLCVPFWAPSANSLGCLSSELIPNPQRRAEYDKATFTSVSTSGTGGGGTYFQWTFTNGADPATIERFGGAKGDLIYDRASGLVFVVTAYTRATGVTVARLLTGARLNGSNWEPNVTFSGTVGTVDVVCLRVYLPFYPITGTFTSGSAAATAVNRGDGTAIGTAIAVGDHVDQDDYSNNWVGATDTRIDAYDSAAKTLSLHGNASVTGARRLAVLTRIVA